MKIVITDFKKSTEINTERGIEKLNELIKKKCTVTNLDYNFQKNELEIDTVESIDLSVFSDLGDVQLKLLESSDEYEKIIEKITAENKQLKVEIDNLKKAK